VAVIITPGMLHGVCEGTLREFDMPVYVWLVAGFLSINTADGKFCALDPTELNPFFVGNNLDLINFIKAQTVWSVYQFRENRRPVVISPKPSKK
jgi:hypothetical protein